MQIIEKGTKVRLKIVGTRVDATEIVGNNILSFGKKVDPLLLVRYWDNQGRPSRCHRVISVDASNKFRRYFVSHQTPKSYDNQKQRTIFASTLAKFFTRTVKSASPRIPRLCHFQIPYRILIVLDRFPVCMRGKRACFSHDMQLLRIQLTSRVFHPLASIYCFSSSRVTPYVYLGLPGASSAIRVFKVFTTSKISFASLPVRSLMNWNSVTGARNASANASFELNVV